VPASKELRWFMADRREHVDRLVQPAIDAGCIVVSDRYFLSTVAYQGARGLDWRELLETNEAEFPAPDLAIVLDIDPADGLVRVKERGGIAEPAFEDAGFLRRVAEIYAAVERPWVAHVDGKADRDAVAAAVRDTVASRIKGLL
jgi:dTMP kinase